MALTKEDLTVLYAQGGLSAQQIAKLKEVSVGQVNYWLGKHRIAKRSISEAVYARANPEGDPFAIQKKTGRNDLILFGLGIGLYWGEGNKRNTHMVRLGNSDPGIIRTFIRFLIELYGIKKEKLRFGIQVFSDMPKGRVERFWQKELNVTASQFYKTVITPARAKGTYTHKSEYGVLTVYFGNKKLRDILCATIAQYGDGVKPM